MRDAEQALRIEYRRLMTKFLCEQTLHDLSDTEEERVSHLALASGHAARIRDLVDACPSVAEHRAVGASKPIRVLHAQAQFERPRRIPVTADNDSLPLHTWPTP